MDEKLRNGLNLKVNIFSYFCILKLPDDEKCDSSVALNAIARFAGTTNIGSKSLPAKELKFTLLRDPTIGHQQVISKLKNVLLIISRVQ